MKPHLAHMHNTLIKKKLAEDAGNQETSYKNYKSLAKRALDEGYAPILVIAELEAELTKIEADEREGDPIFQNGVANAKTSCSNAIKLVINELKEKVNDQLR